MKTSLLGEAAELKMPGISHYPDYTIAMKLQAGQSCRLGRVAGGAELQAGQSCQLGRVAGWVELA